MNLQDVKTLEDIVNYSEGLANDIEAGITDDSGICNAELIAEFATHSAILAKQKIENKLVSVFNAEIENLQKKMNYIMPKNSKEDFSSTTSERAYYSHKASIENYEKLKNAIID